MTQIRKAAVGLGIAAAALTGGALGATMFGSANADPLPSSSSTTSSTTDTDTDNDRHDPTQGGHTGANGTKEELLTGDAAAQATAAALAAVPGGTIERVETDAEGATYEAHMVAADGSRVTVKMDANFIVTGTETGRR